MKNKSQDLLLMNPLNSPSGALLINKPKGKTSFSLVSALRRACNVKKVGHAGTLDPFASGVMVLLVGREFTRLSDRFLLQDKEYEATLQLGTKTDSYDCEGQVLETSSYIPSLDEVSEVLASFQGDLQQVPPMFSAKKVNGKKLYELARKGIEIERAAVPVKVQIQFISYTYPFLKIHVACSKGTYIRSLANDIGIALSCGAHLSDLVRTKSGPFHLSDCFDGLELSTPGIASSLPFLSATDLPIDNK
jgi:tRNA pseudouridine55 synthase